MTLDDLEKLVSEATDPGDIFGEDVEGNLEVFRAICHPDRHPGQERRARAVLDALEQFARFTAEDVEALARAEAVFRSLKGPDEPAQGPTPTIRSPRRVYALVERLGIGDVADVYRARGEGRDYVLKVSRIGEGAHLLEAERAAVAEILKQAGDTHYRDYFPTLAESFPVRDGFPRRVNVFLHEPGLFTLEQVHRRHPELDGRHLAWIFKRLLTALGFAHRCGRVHGAIVPAHVLVHAEGHGLRLVGWGHSVEEGQRILTGPAKYLDWYPAEVRRKEAAVPATDIYLAAKCLVYLAGGDPVSGRMPDTLPRALGASLRSCLLEGPRMRPDDAWGLLDEFDELLFDLYGPPKYRRLEMP
jgi:serine/threonine protein kinase